MEVLFLEASMQVLDVSTPACFKDRHFLSFFESMQQ